MNHCRPVARLLLAAVVVLIAVAVVQLYRFPSLIFNTAEYYANGRKPLLRLCAGSGYEDIQLRSRTAVLKDELIRETRNQSLGLHLVNPCLLTVPGANNQTGQALADRWHDLLDERGI